MKIHYSFLLSFLIGCSSESPQSAAGSSSGCPALGTRDPVSGLPVGKDCGLDAGSSCRDESAPVPCGQGINLGSTPESAAFSRPWFAFKYVSAVDQTIGKACIGATSPTKPTTIYLLDDDNGVPGAVRKSGDLYGGDPGFACTLDAPFDFSAALDAGRTYWIASDVDAVSLAVGGAMVPYWLADQDPGQGAPSWDQPCSAAFIARLDPKIACK